jgi:hypothetical protein
MEIEGIKVVHALPGRVRLKVARVKGNPPLAREAQEKLAKVPGIQRIETKPTTGSLLIHYDTGELFSLTSLEILSATLAEIFPEIEVVSLASWLSSLAENFGPVAQTGSAAGISGAFKAFSPGGIDLKLLIPLTLILFGVRAFWLSEKITFPAWYDYLWFGASTFIMLNRGVVEGHRSADVSPAPAP